MKKLICIILIFSALLLFQRCKTSKPLVSEQIEVSNQPLEKTREQSRVSSIFIEANKERLLGNPKRAMLLYQQCIEKDPRHAPSFYEISRLFQMQFNMSEAVKMSKKAVEIDSDNKWYLLQLAGLYQGTGQNALAAQAYRDLLSSDIGNLEYNYELANIYMRMNRFASAIEVLNIIETQIGITEEISVQKQKMFMLSGSLKEAIAETEKLSAAFPNESRYYSMLAELHLSNKDYNKALNYYNKVTEIDPTNPYVRISLAEYYRTIGNKHQSFVELKKGFANPTLDIDTKIQVMMSYYSVTEIYDELKGQAFELAEVLVETHPDDPKSHSMLADFLVREERYEEARDSFRKVISLDASRYIIWETLLRLDIMLNDIGSLEIDSQKTIELFPLQPMPYMFAGLGAYQSNHYTDALKMFNAGKDMVVDDIELAAEFYMYLGDVYNQLKDHKLSDQSYEKSLQLKPDNPSVLNNFSYFLALRKARLDEAEQMAKRANELAPDNKHYLDTYAWVLYQKGNYPEALRWLERALQHTGTDNAVVLEHYGDVLFKLYRINEAQEYWRRAAKTGKGSEFLEKKIKEGILYE